MILGSMGKTLSYTTAQEIWQFVNQLEFRDPRYRFGWTNEDSQQG